MPESSDPEQPVPEETRLDPAQPRDAPPGQSRGIGYRFKRPLTSDDLTAIATAATRVGERGGPHSAVEVTWDILLQEAEGPTWAEASRRGLRFHPGEYAIPQSQAEVLLGSWQRHRGARSRTTDVAMTWFNIGPAAYPDPADAEPEHASPGEAQDA